MCCNIKIITNFFFLSEDVCVFDWILLFGDGYNSNKSFFQFFLFTVAETIQVESIIVWMLLNGWKKLNNFFSTILTMMMMKNWSNHYHHDDNECDQFFFVDDDHNDLKWSKKNEKFHFVVADVWILDFYFRHDDELYFQ